MPVDATTTDAEADVAEAPPRSLREKLHKPIWVALWPVRTWFAHFPIRRQRIPTHVPFSAPKCRSPQICEYPEPLVLSVYQP